MLENEEYVKRLENIIDKQDELLSQFDAKFNEINSFYKSTSKRNSILTQDLIKHKDILKDMNVRLNKQKNTIAKLKKDLEQRLKIQQKLHKDYGEQIQKLTEELEGKETKKELAIKESANNNATSDRPKLPPKDDKPDYISEATTFLSDVAEKSQKKIKEATHSNESDSTNIMIIRRN